MAVHPFLICRRHKSAPLRLPNTKASRRPLPAACYLLQGASAARAAEPAAEPAPVALVTTLGCPYCKQAKAALQVRSPRAWTVSEPAVSEPAA